MGVHWCGWCGQMSGGGFCEECEVEAGKEMKELENILSFLPKDKLERAKKIINRAMVAEANTD